MFTYRLHPGRRGTSSAKPELAAEQLDEAGPLPLGALDGLMRAMLSSVPALTGPIFGTATRRSNTSALAR